MNSTKERVLNICTHVSDLPLLPVSVDIVWLIELFEHWFWLLAWSPGKIPMKYIQPIVVGSSFPMPLGTLDPNGVMSPSAREAAAHTPSPVARERSPLNHLQWHRRLRH